MSSVKNFWIAVRTALLGGVVVLLPAAILVMVFKWIYNLVSGLISPITTLLFDEVGFMANLFVTLVILVVCFALGVIVKTNKGRFFQQVIEKNILSKVPGYSLSRDIVLQFFGKKKNAFSSVALVKLFGNDTMITAFITDEHTNGMVTVFMPTGPNPTSGNIYHVKSSQVYKVDVSVETAMRSIISCGAGSDKIIYDLDKRVYTR